MQNPGPIILDNEGNLVWMGTEYGQAMDVKVQKYRGNDYITFWHGDDSGWFGRGYYLMLDSSYNIFKNVTAAGDLDGDLHEFQITEDGTALLTAYQAQAADLTAYGVEIGLIYDSIFQEIDLETGELLFEWRASDWYPVTESLAPYESYQGAWDYYHINSVDKDEYGNYLVSSRYMCAVSYIDGTTGQILWQVGGKHNSFTDLSSGHATDFSWQHHARLHHTGPSRALLTVFDNGAYYNKALLREDHSRGLLVDLDTASMTATLRHALVAPQAHVLVPSQGSVNVLPASGTVLVGWGHHPAWTEYDAATGAMLCDTHLGAAHLAAYGRVKNYRTFKSAWVGTPAGGPDAVVRDGGEVLFVSWNGATADVKWVVQTHDDDDLYQEFLHTRNVTVVAKQGFETEISLVGLEVGNYVQVMAVDAEDQLLGYSEVIETETGLYMSGKAVPEPEAVGLQDVQIVFLSVLAGIISGSVLLYKLRSVVHQGAYEVVQRVKLAVGAKWHSYDAVAQKESSDLHETGDWGQGGGMFAGKDWE